MRGDKIGKVKRRGEEKKWGKEERRKEERR